MLHIGAHDHKKKKHTNEFFLLKISDQHQIYEIMHAHKRVHINAFHVNH